MKMCSMRTMQPYEQHGPGRGGLSSTCRGQARAVLHRHKMFGRKAVLMQSAWCEFQQCGRTGMQAVVASTFNSGWHVRRSCAA